MPASLGDFGAVDEIENLHAQGLNPNVTPHSERLTPQ